MSDFLLFKQEMITVKKMLLIMNPHSGMKRANKYLTDILIIFSKYDYDVNVKLTTGAGDATEYAKKYGKDVSLIVCIGGDGTFNETIQGILESGCKTPLGYIPAGSTNDFATSLGISKKPLEAARDIMTGIQTGIDIGVFNDRYFSYIASFGAFTKVSYTTSQNKKNLLGHTAYVLEGLKDIPTIRAEHLKFKIGDKEFEDDYIFGAVCNSTSIGGFSAFDQDVVDLKDGLFEILLVKSPKNLIELNTIIFSANNRDYNNDMVTFISASEAVITASESLSWSLDGERMEGCTEIKMKIIPSALTLVVPYKK